jgi:ferredoxin--NADP+ reductase
VEGSRGIRVIPVLGSTERTGHRFDPEKLASVGVLENEQLAPDTWRLSFARDWDFVPGQSVALATDRAMPPRFYSIASGAAESRAAVLYDVVSEGLLTPRLAELRPGDTLLCSAPFGAFRDADGPSCWIAAGTGIAPFVSMAKSTGLAGGKTLLHGSRTAAGLLEREMFVSLLGPRYVPCCTREKAEGIFAGRTTDWLSSHPLPSARRFLLCGSSLMVVDARDILIRGGVPFEDVIAEIYF